MAARLAEVLRDRQGRLAIGSGASPDTKAPDLNAIISQMVSRLRDHQLRLLKPTDGVQDMLSGLHGQVKMAVVSNVHIVGWPEFVLDRFGLGHYFDFVLDSAAFGVKKPGTAIYEEALQRAAASPQQVLFVGDSLANDVLAPRRMGMRAVHYRPETGDATDGTGAQAPAHEGVSHWRDLLVLLSLGA